MSKPLVVGTHPQNVSLSLLARRPEQVEALREQGIEFFNYSAGDQTLALVKLGVLALAGTGATPPILAKARGLDIAVFGMSAPRPDTGGLCVRADSPIQSIRDLKGHNVALMPISWHLQFLAAELDAAGLDWREINAVDLFPPTAANALEQGFLQAIVTTDPLYSRLAARVPLRLLAPVGGAFTNRSVYWGRHDVLRDRPEAVQALVDALAASDRETEARPEEAAALLAGLNGHSLEEWLAIIRLRAWGVHAPDAGFLAEQQHHADIFVRFGLVPERLDVTDTVDNRFPPSFTTTQGL